MFLLRYLCIDFQPASQNPAPEILRILINRANLPTLDAVRSQLSIAGRLFTICPTISRQSAINDKQIFQPFLPSDVAVKHGVYFQDGIAAKLFRRQAQFSQGDRFEIFK
jgi:hypothetical protein